MTLALAFSHASAAFENALETELARANLDGLVDPGMGPILFRLEEQKNLTLSELAAASHVPRSTMTGIAARLGGRGLVRIATNPLDRRSMVVALTPKGRTTVATLRIVERRLNETFRASALGEKEADFVAWLEDLAGTLHAKYD